MSDGPHRNLPLGRHWKSFVQRAENPSYKLPDMLETLEPALAFSFRHAVPGALLTRSLKIVTDPQISLNAQNGVAGRLRHVRDTTPAGRLGADFLTSLLIALEDGHHGRQAIQDAAVRVLSDLAGNRKRQIEGHCLTHPSPQAQLVPKRSARAFGEIDLERLADRLVDPGWAPSRNPRRKKSGIDDGIRLNEPNDDDSH